MLAISRCFSGSIAAKPRLDVLPPELPDELLRELPDEFLELALMPDLLPELLLLFAELLLLPEPLLPELLLPELLLDCETMMTSFRKTSIFQKIETMDETVRPEISIIARKTTRTWR